jgi:hypothetical protein
MAEELLLPAPIGPIMIRPHIVCADGFQISVQASQFHYCSPRRNVGPWESFEVGFPSEHEPMLDEYGDGTDVYGWVPFEVVKAILDKHGGADHLEGEGRFMRVEGL